MAYTLENYKHSVLYFGKQALNEYGFELSSFEEAVAALVLDDYVTGWRNHDWVEDYENASLIINDVVCSAAIDEVCDYFNMDYDEMLRQHPSYVDSAIRVWVLETQVRDELKEEWDTIQKEIEDGW